MCPSHAFQWSLELVPCPRNKKTKKQVWKQQRQQGQQDNDNDHKHNHDNNKKKKNNHNNNSNKKNKKNTQNKNQNISIYFGLSHSTRFVPTCPISEASSRAFL